MAAEQTLVLLKPDAMQRKLAGEILRRLGRQEMLEDLDRLSTELVPAGAAAAPA